VTDSLKFFRDVLQGEIEQMDERLSLSKELLKTIDQVLEKTKRDFPYLNVGKN
jgi:hypothetical protein